HDGTVRLWDTASHREIGTLGQHGLRVVAGDISPDGQWAVTGGIDGGLRLWDMNTLAESGAAELPAEVRGLFFLPDGDSFLAADSSGLLTMLSAPAFEVRDQLDTGGRPLCGDLSMSGDQLVVGGEDGRVRFFSVEGLEEAVLPVAAKQSVKKSSKTLFDKLLGKNRAVHTYQFTCPACRKLIESNKPLPAGPFHCSSCQRMLRVGTLHAELQAH
ncbi:MAG: WD40 repeat domain-containing protein, partial [Candidatus Acidiferrum sp.]